MHGRRSNATASKPRAVSARRAASPAGPAPTIASRTRATLTQVACGPVNLDPPFSDPAIPDGERTGYRGTIGDHEVGTGELRVEAADDRYVAHLETRILGDFNQTVEMSFARSRGMVRAESYRAESRDGDRPVRV